MKKFGLKIDMETAYFASDPPSVNGFHLRQWKWQVDHPAISTFAFG